MVGREQDLINRWDASLHGRTTGPAWGTVPRPQGTGIPASTNEDYIPVPNPNRRRHSNNTTPAATLTLSDAIAPAMGMRTR